jgi:UDP-N-acetylmuramoyl-tripeptide--D-alanyl-D-alanine ligase
VTGSSGKTSTKDLLAGALATSRRVTASPASHNNELGVPATLLNAPDDVEVVVCELGARGIGHIALLCGVVRPTVGVVTNVGTAHSAMYADGPLGILQAKGELVASLPTDGTAVLNADDPATPALAERTVARVLTFGVTPAADVAVQGLALDDELRPRFRLATPWGTADVRLEARGAHQAANAAAAAAAALAVGAPLDAVAAGLGGARLSPWRMEIGRTAAGALVVNDAYNANPESVAAALDALAAVALPAGGRRIAVLGPMAELGAAGSAAHRAVGRRAADLGIDVLVAVGVDATGIAEGYVVSPGEGRAVVVVDAGAALDEVGRELAPADAVLVKASRVAGLEAVAHALLAGAPRAAAAAAVAVEEPVRWSRCCCRPRSPSSSRSPSRRC